MIELDVISGFLGAGKTTLANALLAHYIEAWERAVYIVNEFGETDTDAALLRSEGFSAVTLPGGCICCTLRADLALALRDIIDTFAPTKIVFETSGIFIYDSFEEVLQDAYLSAHCRVRRTVAVVDSLNIQKIKKAALLVGSFIENQLKNSSVIVVSKLERFAGDLSELICDLKAIAPQAALMARRWDEEGFIDELLSAGDDGERVWVSGHGHAHFDAVTIKPETAFTADSYGRFIERALSGKLGEFLRIKGVVVVDGQPQRLNIAMDDVVLQPAGAHEEPRLTFIGRGFNKASVRHLLKV
jgi:G3E family GTPase